MNATARLGGAALFRPLPPGSLERRVVEGFDECLDRWGPEKTTVDDIARAAEMSRATVYRAVPGGKTAIVELHRRHQIACFFGDLDAAVGSDADLDELLVTLLHTAARLLADDETFQRRLAEQPDQVLPELTFRGLDRIFAACRVFLGTLLEAHLDPSTAARTAEWLARIVLWHQLDERTPTDLTDRDQARALVDDRILPALRAATNTTTNTTTTNTTTTNEHQGEPAT